MIPMALKFLGSKLGGWLVMGAVCALLGGWIYIDGLRLAAKDGEIKGLNGQIVALNAKLDSAVATNGRQAETIRQITEDAATAKARADQAAQALAAATARTDEKTRTIIRETKHVPSDDDPITDGERDLLVRLRAAYPATANGH